MALPPIKRFTTNQVSNADILAKDPPTINNQKEKMNINDITQGASTGLGYLGQMVGTVSDLAGIADTSGITSEINYRNITPINAVSNEDVLNQFANYNDLDPLTYRQVRGKTGKQVLGGIGQSTIQGAQAGKNIGGMFGASGSLYGGIAGTIIGATAGGIGAGVGKNKALRKQRVLNDDISQSNFLQKNALANAASRVDTANDRALLSSYSYAQGGPLSKGLTSYANYANKYQPAVLYADGGSLHTNGTIFDNGLSYFNAGQSHEENPHQGVQIGVDPQGVPNLVEEGEVMYNDYVYSNRLLVPKSIKKELKLKNKKKLSFADAAKDLAKESEERPNDPISAAGMEAMLSKLAEVQEEVRFKDQMKDPELLQQAMMAMQQQGAQQQAMQEQQMAQQQMSPEEQAMMEQQAMQEYGAQGEEMQQQVSPEEQMLMQQMQGMSYACGGKVRKYAYGGGLNNGFMSNPYATNAPVNLFDVGGPKEDTTSNSEKTEQVINYTDELKRAAKELNVSGHFLLRYLGLDRDSGLTKEQWINAYNYTKNQSSTKSTDNVSDTTTTKTSEPTKSTDTKSTTPVDLKEALKARYNAIPGAKPFESGIANMIETGMSQEDIDAFLTENGVVLPEDKEKPLPTWMRYAPVTGSALSLIQNALEQPDYSRAEAIERSATPVPGVSFSPIGGYLQYNPADINYLANSINAQEAAQRNAILNNANGNRATAVSGLLANDYNNQIALGNAYIAAQKENDERRRAVMTSNNEIDKYNSTGALQAAEQNANIAAQNRTAYMTALKDATDMRNTIDATRSAAIANSMNNFATNLGAIGKENFVFNQTKSNPYFKYTIDSNGNISYIEPTGTAATTPNTGAKGGYLTIKKKRKHGK